jgi:integrase
MWQHDWHTSPQEDRPELRNLRRLSKLGGPSQISAGGSLRDVQQLVGHASLATTQKYIEGDTEAKRKLVNLI